MPSHLPRKRFGQHFLTDEAVILQIIQSLELNQTDRLVEIGPGLGALTHPLLHIVSHLDVIEIDRDLISKMQTWQAYQENRLSIHAGDVLDFDFSTFQPKPHETLKLVGNLPYNISTPLLIKLVTQAHHFSQMVFMLQKEVVDRLVAKPGNKSYGRLSVFIQYFCETIPLFDIPPDAFNPPPKVNSACILLQPRKHIAEPVKNLDHFQLIVQTAFAHRRKTLSNNFKQFPQTIPWEDLKIDSRARAETLSMTDFIHLSNALQSL